MFTRSLTRLQPQLFSRRLITSSRIPKYSSFLNQSPVNIIKRNYVIIHKQRKKEPVLRYLFYMIVLSWGFIYYVANRVDKKTVKKDFSEREFQQYEEATGVKRRNKLISGDLSSKYKFYVIPYINDNEQLDKIVNLLKSKDEGTHVKIIDPSELIEQQKQDEGLRYHYLLHDLEEQKRPYPQGLITALVKQEINNYSNTRQGTFETNFIIKNYPQTTAEAIKFENDVADVQKCLILHFDMLNELPKYKNEEEQRAIQNVDGYFDSVGRAKTLIDKFDPMDEEFEEIMMEDL
ncbi:hypothetical protein CTRG_01377 [Candida tropicalis MYA-3404]|uniref:Altered inheritance of mitochondria protein 36, mitochondrial n=1 Tax=Candida tropicalis (strain ATCC MYA-3404 / T1) TaxID=294747 RepID=AIM36_CANTT|nr:hypothetical protein CTRG_01377 [Candida tropicalis MYA-3404]C5M696.1 RecName: Full=Altered inheritance of mitochondria protein 36, mitochondrial; AltName: Full=Found in mitochondria protein 39; Flags: Precursor [Candida tropicalis MYA-3404]EER34516.1 hypothetical protein CTRG_01377 [Candida tropicalis MYA-3404]KAG4408389.1 hypothetical protein JTP64_001695 [Candida tropicalis]